MATTLITIASILASIISLISLNRTNNHLTKVEKYKSNNNIHTFRYTSLYNLNVEINELPSVDYSYLEKKDGKLEQNQELLANVVSALFNQDYLVEIEQLILDEKEESSLLVDSLYGSGKEGDLKKLLKIRQSFEEIFQKGIINQLEILIKIPNI